MKSDFFDRFRKIMTDLDAELSEIERMAYEDVPRQVEAQVLAQQLGPEWVED